MLIHFCDSQTDIDLQKNLILKKDFWRRRRIYRVETKPGFANAKSGLKMEDALKRFIVFIFILSTVFTQLVYAENQLKFDRWPLDDFMQESIIKGFGDGHFGLDIQAPEGTPVYTPVSGKVYWTYSGGSHGTSIGIEHESGTRMTFLHLSERLVKKGQVVESGQEIGKVGMTGSGRDSEPPHLHFSVIVTADAPVTEPEIRYANPLDFSPVAPVLEEPKINNTAIEPVEQVKPAIINQVSTNVPMQKQVPETGKSLNVNQEKPVAVLKPSVAVNTEAENADKPATKLSGSSKVKTLDTEKPAKIPNLARAPINNVSEVNPMINKKIESHYNKIEAQKNPKAKINKIIKVTKQTKTPSPSKNRYSESSGLFGKGVKIGLIIMIFLIGIFYYIWNRGSNFDSNNPADKQLAGIMNLIKINKRLLFLK